jgi:hypothetical protein
VIGARTRRVEIADRHPFQTQLDCVLVEFSPTSWANEELSIYSESQFEKLLQQWYQQYWYRLRQIRNAGSRCNSPRSVTIEIVNAAIIVLLILLATGVVVSPLLRLRVWLKRTPPAQEFQLPPDEDAD